MSVSEELMCSFELLTPTDHPRYVTKTKGRRAPSPPLMDALPSPREEQTVA